ncbi:hypothetical cytosolic protein [Syntrophus aciditrophicus SB]|uniref:Hypothetical cytosolic protein n=2 Tax=Syntrophus TaxID=43773 RepID=Q2LQ16_SYNAS|nr:hypothetical cytosolic protein [Syntrophus aciditrophicus SB]
MVTMSMEKIIFLLEEPSMKVFLEEFLPRFLPDLEYLCITHEGKQDLEKSIPRKLKAFRRGVFVIVRDNDGADCYFVKKRLMDLCKGGGQSDVLIRIVCQELESWYLGVMDVLADVYNRPRLTGLNRKAKYRNPDRLGSPSSELVKLIPEFRKIEGTRQMGTAMPLRETENFSISFQFFIKGVHQVINNMEIRKKARHSAMRQE